MHAKIVRVIASIFFILVPSVNYFCYLYNYHFRSSVNFFIYFFIVDIFQVSLNIYFFLFYFPIYFSSDLLLFVILKKFITVLQSLNKKYFHQFPNCIWFDDIYIYYEYHYMTLVESFSIDVTYSTPSNQCKYSTVQYKYRNYGVCYNTNVL